MSNLSILTEERKTLGKLREALEAQEAKVAQLYKALYEESGKGPYDFGDDRPGGWLIANRGDKVFFAVPKVKPRKAAEG